MVLVREFQEFLCGDLDEGASEEVQFNSYKTILVACQSNDVPCERVTADAKHLHPVP